MSHSPKYFTHTQDYYRFIILKKIQELGFIELPINTKDQVLMDAFSKVHLNNLIQDGLLVKKEELISITPKGLESLSRHYIDYQINLIDLSKNLGNFYSEKISELVKNVESPAALYGASDTLKSFFPFLKEAGLTFSCVIDDDGNKQGGEYLGLPVIGLNELSRYDIKTIVISSIAFQGEIENKIVETYPNQYKIKTIFK